MKIWTEPAPVIRPVHDAISRRRIAKIYLTREGAMKRAAFERVHGKPNAHVVPCNGGWQVEY